MYWMFLPAPMAWKKTGVALATMAAGTKREVTVDGTSILLVSLGENIYAVDGICTHQGGILADGELDGQRIICPVHGANFDVTSGIVLIDPDGIEPPQGIAEPLPIYPTRIESGMIEVDVAGS